MHGYQENSQGVTDLQQKVSDRAVGEHIAHKLLYGDPDVGWEGDPWLVLTLDPDGFWRAWDTKNGEPDLICQKKADGRELDTSSLCARLRDGSLRRQSVTEILDRVDAKNDEVEAAAAKAQAAVIAEEAERAAFEISRTLE